MISYELAKQLKEAGFSQKGKGETLTTVPPGTVVDNPEQFEEYYPTLSELIEACGDEFYSIVYAFDGNWRCFSEVDKKNTVAVEEGNTPEEAIARLWLALNKK